MLKTNLGRMFVFFVTLLLILLPTSSAISIKTPDIRFIGYDIYQLFDEGVGEDYENLKVLGLDIAGAAVPYATGLGLTVRTGRVASSSGRSVSFVRQTDNLANIRKGAETSGVRALRGASKSDDLVIKSQRIADRLGPATTTVGGTAKHREATGLLKQSGLKDVYTEVSIKDSVIAPYGTKDSTRIDAIRSPQDLSKIGTRVDPTQTQSAVDFKFGQSGLTSQQAARIQKQTGVKPVEIKPQKQSIWSKIKSYFSRKK